MAPADPGDPRLRASLQGLIGALDLLAEATGEVERQDWLALARSCADELAAILGAGAPAPQAGRPLRILVADDVETNRLLLGAMLGKAGHRVAFAEDGNAALAAAGRGGYDLIVMDMLMPGLDGLAATRAIRALPGAAGRVPILGLSGNAEPEDRRLAREAGLDAHLGKPVDRAALFDSIRRLTAPADDMALDPAALAQLKADVGTAQFATLLADYRVEIVQRLDALAAPDALADPARLAHHAHDLQSSAAMVGAATLSAAAAALARAAREPGEDLPRCRDAVLAARAAALGALDEALRGAGGT